MEQNNELKTKLISDYVDRYSQDYIDSQVETEVVILDTFEQLMKEYHKNSKEYKNAKSEYDKQIKVLEYFKSNSFADLYKSEYKKQMEVLTLEQVQYLIMQQELIFKVKGISKNMTSMIIDLAENVAGEQKLSA
ncbi:hypothetical protein vBAcePPAc_0147 [Aeromonas phage vB_AceP_PAc]|nr:hypothetical protein vBAcePPAc_0147 [Aeromonas phage vB_AceP_PAc]